jgi:hypothetical protein
MDPPAPLEISNIRLRLRHLRFEDVLPIIAEIKELGQAAAPLIPDMIAAMPWLRPCAYQFVEVICTLKSTELLNASGYDGVGGFLGCQLLRAGFLQFQQPLLDELFRGFESDSNLAICEIADALAESGTTTALETLRVIEYRLAARIAELRAERNFGDSFEVGVDQLMRGEHLPVRVELLQKVRRAIERIGQRPNPLPVGSIEEGLDAPQTSLQKENTRDLLNLRESNVLEFKAGLRWDPAKGQIDEKLERRVLQTIVSFANRDGGTLLIGVNDAKDVVGLQMDFDSLKGSCDAFERHLRNIITSSIGKSDAVRLVTTVFERFGDHEICRISIEASPEPLFLKDEGKEKFFVRNGNANLHLDGREMANYVRRHFQK